MSKRATKDDSPHPSKKHGRTPQRIGDVVAQLLSRSGYAQTEVNRRYQEVWNRLVGPRFENQSSVGGLRNGVLQVTVANSSVLQELTFQKRDFIEKLQTEFSEAVITDLRFRIGVTTNASWEKQ